MRIRVVKSCGAFRLLGSALLFLGGLFSMPAGGSEDVGNVLSMGRMGAGAPAGWRVTGDHYVWDAEESEGPFGPGAGRIRFRGKGVFELDSPGQRLTPGKGYVLALWWRSDSGEARLDMEVRDNDAEEGSGFRIQASGNQEWGCVSAHDVLFPAVKSGYYVHLRVSGTDCTVWLDGLWLGEKDTAVEASWKPPLLPVGVVLEPAAPWGLVTGNEVMRVRTRVVGAVAPGCRLVLHAAHVTGSAWDLEALPIEGGGIWRGEFSIPEEVGASFGMLRVEGRVVGRDGESLSPQGETLLARAPVPAPGPCPESPFGTHVLLKEPDLGVAAKLGYKWCRIHDASCITKWGCAEPEQGRWVWHDEQVSLARGHGFCVLGMLDSAPQWASGNTEGGYFGIYHAPKNIEDWRVYVREMVSHHKGFIDDWEVWNEPWDMFRFFRGGNPALYAVLLEAAWQEAKAVNPGCTIVGVDTYPPMWDAAVLMLGAYPHYDVLSWHRYDSNLQGRPNDSIARVSRRLSEVQKPFGPPKPVLCSEGGIDVTLYHGSYFSFAEEALTGDWSRGADLYVRWYLSAIAGGQRRFFSYSMHGFPRHGQPTHMMLEPDPLLRPLHLALSGLAHFVEGAGYERRLRPSPDISALLFRGGGNGPELVVALFSDGEEPEELPRPLPAGVACFDRWSNPIPTPIRAARSPVYLCATSDDCAALMEALQPNPVPSPPIPSMGTPEELLKGVLSAVEESRPPLWTLFSTQGSVALCSWDDGITVATRSQLRDEVALASRFQLPGGLVIKEQQIWPAGMFSIIRARVTGEAQGKPASWTMSCTAVQDGPGNGYRLAHLSFVPDAIPAAEDDVHAIAALLKRWEQSLLKGSTRELHGLFHRGPKSLTTATLNGEYFVFTDPEHLITMMNTVVMWGSAKKSELHLDGITIFGNAATVTGRWDIDFLAFGSGAYAVSANLVKEDGAWKMVSLCCSAGKASPPPLPQAG